MVEHLKLLEPNLSGPYVFCFAMSCGFEGGRPTRSGPAPVERDVLGRIQRVFELEAVRVDRQNRRLPPGDELRSGPGFAARRVHQLWVLPRRASRSANRLGPGFDLAEDFDTPMAQIRRDLISDFGPLDAAALPPPGEALVDPAGEAASTATDDCR